MLLATPLPTRHRLRLCQLLLAGLALALVLGVAASDARASLLWTGDAEKPVSQEWASSAAPGAACAVAPPNVTTRDLNVTPAPLPVVGPVASHLNAYHFQINDGEPECFGERSELGQANPENPRLGDRKFYPGQEVWVAFEAYLPSDYQIEDPNGYSTGLMQFKQIGGHGYPAMQMRDGGGHLCFYVDSLQEKPETKNCDSRTFELGAPAKNAWIKLLFHVYFSGDKPGENPGYVEIYGDLQDGKGFGLLLPKVVARTSKLNEEEAGEPPLPTQARIGIFRNPVVKGTEDLYVDGFAAATDRASAEEVAFGGANLEAGNLGSPAVSPVPQRVAARTPSPAAPSGAPVKLSSSAASQHASARSTPSGPAGRAHSKGDRVPGPRVTLRLRRISVVTARRHGKRVWIVGRVSAFSGPAEKKVVIEIRVDGRWKRFAVTGVRARRQFSLVTALPRGTRALRAYYSGAYSRVLSTDVRHA